MGEQIELADSNGKFVLEATNIIPAVWMSLFDETDIKLEEYHFESRKKNRSEERYFHT